MPSQANTSPVSKTTTGPAAAEHGGDLARDQGG